MQRGGRVDPGAGAGPPGRAAFGWFVVGPGLGDRRVVQGELTEGHTGLARGTEAGRTFQAEGAACLAEHAVFGFPVGGGAVPSGQR